MERQKVIKLVAVVFSVSLVLAAANYFLGPWYGMTRARKQMLAKEGPAMVLKVYSSEQTAYKHSHGVFDLEMHRQERFVKTKDVHLFVAADSELGARLCKVCRVESDHYLVGAYSDLDEKRTVWTINQDGAVSAQ